MEFLRKLKERVDTLYASRWLNKYSIAAILFALWICFFDKHNIMTQWQLRSTVREMEKSKVDYENLLVKAIEDKKDIEINEERYAREKYFMHKDDEDVFIIDRK